MLQGEDQLTVTINKGESADMQLISKAFPEAAVTEEQKKESVSAAFVQTDQGDDLDFYEQLAGQGQDDRQSLEEFEREFEEHQSSAWADYERMIQGEQQRMGRGR